MAVGKGLLAVLAHGGGPESSQELAETTVHDGVTLVTWTSSIQPSPCLPHIYTGASVFKT